MESRLTGRLIKNWICERKLNDSGDHLVKIGQERLPQSWRLSFVEAGSGSEIGFGTGKDDELFQSNSARSSARTSSPSRSSTLPSSYSRYRRFTSSMMTRS